MAALAIIAGCRSPMPSSQRNVVSADLSSRTGSGIGPGGGLTAGSVPGSVILEDGLTSDEAATLALWNNAAYNELLAQLGVSRSQVYDAGLLPDPQLVIFFPVGTKQLEFTTFQAVDAIWLRPIRRRAAELDLCELAQQMVQNGLDVVRDARVAHTNLLLAQETADLSATANQLLDEIAKLAEKRLEAGDISELEATSSRIEQLRAAATAAAAEQDVRLAQEQLRNLIGVGLDPNQLRAIDESDRDIAVRDPSELVAAAHAMRPDLRALEIRKAAACRRADLARNSFMNLDAVFDANGEGTDGFEAGAGLRMTLPFCNANKGGIAVADALVRQVDHQYAAARDRIDLEVRTAVAQWEQADEQRELVDTEILPALQEAQTLARRNYELGGVPYFLVLQTTTQYVDAQLRRAQALASVQRAHAELDRSVGRRVRTVEINDPPVAPAKPEVSTAEDEVSGDQ